MQLATLQLTSDLSIAGVLVALGVLGAAAIALLVELRLQTTKRRWLVAGLGLLATLALALAVFRPAQVVGSESEIGPKVVVLVDRSRRLRLPSERRDVTRAELAADALEKLRRRYRDARFSAFSFSDGDLMPLGAQSTALPTNGAHSDLERALRQLGAAGEEWPAALVVVSDGRLLRPTQDALASPEGLRSLGNVPIHSVQLMNQSPSDASVREIRSTGVAVAHQPFPITVVAGCHDHESCKDLRIEIRELKHDAAPHRLASGTTDASSGTGVAEFTVTLGSTGSRVLEVSVLPEGGDAVPGNDVRRVTFKVTRERLRLLHLAGRPTYDVRALRQWLKADQSVDVIAFFILRDFLGDDPGARSDELALIEFPVDELFTKHLNSFDAIILQDIDAKRYDLDRYFKPLAEYVTSRGGGLIMVGGPSSFSGGSYAGTPLDDVLPVGPTTELSPVDPGAFEPRYTNAGQSTTVTRSLRDLLGLTLPTMNGVNHVGAARKGSIVLWEHPTLSAQGRPMPLLALGEAGDGRSIALAVDATHRLAFGPLAAKVGGRAYGALWDGLLGWLMRDPRYEAARLELLGECIEGEPARFRLTKLPDLEGAVSVQLTRLEANASTAQVRELTPDELNSQQIAIEGLRAGGYSARTRVGESPPSRTDFACEPGGIAWADSRPDPALLGQLSRTTGGAAVGLDGIDDLPEPKAELIAAQRESVPILPPWSLTLAAAVFLGGYWAARRSSGLA